MWNHRQKLILSRTFLLPYDFDKLFYKFPSYFRRSAIQDALGSVSSYKSNLANWEKTRKGRRPFLKLNQNKFPCFYKDNMFNKLDDYKEKIESVIKSDVDETDKLKQLNTVKNPIKCSLDNLFAL